MRPWLTLTPAARGPIKVRFSSAVALSGPVWAAIQFGEVIARKSLGASAIAITLITMLNPLVNFTAIWWSRILEGRDQRRIILITGLLGHLAIMTGIWLTHLPHLLVMFLFYYVAYAAYQTGQNRVLQQHVEKETHGALFGVSNGIRMALAAGASYFAGLWMDHHPDGFRHVFLITGAIGAIGIVLFATLPTRRDPNHRHYRPNHHNLLTPLREAWRLLKRRPDYLRFELGFMVYGIAFMMMLPVVPIFLVDDLTLDYTAIGLAKGAIFQVVTILSITWFGKLYDRMTPHALASRVFLLLAVHPVMLIFSWLFPALRLPIVYAAFGLFGFAMAGVSVLWSVSSVRFAGEEDAGVYQAVHVAATAVRGSFAPLLGYLVMTFFGRLQAMGLAAFFWIAAGIIMAWLDRSDGQAMRPEAPLAL